jgi:hypothetical protein
MSSTTATSPVTFASTYAAFLEDPKGTFPEYTAALTLASTLPDLETRFTEVWHVHSAAVAAQDASLFDGAGIELVPGFVMTRALWNELGSGSHSAIWKYLSTLLLLVASHNDTMWDLSGFQQSMEEMMKHLKESTEEGGSGTGEGFSSLFEKIGKMAETFGLKDLSGAASNFKIPERLFKGHIAKIVEELVKEFKPEDFGITPEMLEAKDPKDVFGYLQEIFTKKPDTLMAAGQKIAKKLQAKFASGAIKREEIIREVEELMKEFSDNEAFSELFGGLGDMLKSSDKETGNEGSARRREVQERLRRKAAEKAARRGGAGTTPPVNSVVYEEAEMRAAAAAAALILEEEEASKKRGSSGSGSGAPKGRKK